MRKTPKPRADFIRILIVASFLTAAAGAAVAQKSVGDTPENANAKSYGSGWECKKGFRENNGACLAVNIPANAYPTNVDYGPGWECKRGYRTVGKTCVAIQIPENAYLESGGNRWKCERGFRRAGKACIAVKIPANAYFVDTSYGSGWACDRGYRMVGETCVAVHVPENAYPTQTDYGRGWECKRGYHAVGETCAAVKIPENAHLDYSGNAWIATAPTGAIKENVFCLNGCTRLAPKKNIRFRIFLTPPGFKR